MKARGDIIRIYNAWVGKIQQLNLFQLRYIYFWRVFVLLCFVAAKHVQGEGIGGEDVEHDSRDDSLSTVTLLNQTSVVYIG